MKFKMKVQRGVNRKWKVCAMNRKKVKILMKELKRKLSRYLVIWDKLK